MGGYVPGLGALNWAAEAMAGKRLAELEARVESEPFVAAETSAKLRRGQPVTRKEAATFLGTSTKKLQRMEAAGKLARCSGWGTDVKLEARDVLRLASANGKER